MRTSSCCLPNLFPWSQRVADMIMSPKLSSRNVISTYLVLPPEAMLLVRAKGNWVLCGACSECYMSMSPKQDWLPMSSTSPISTLRSRHLVARVSTTKRRPWNSIWASTSHASLRIIQTCIWHRCGFGSSAAHSVRCSSHSHFWHLVPPSRSLPNSCHNNVQHVNNILEMRKVYVLFHRLSKWIYQWMELIKLNLRNHLK